MKTTEKIDMLKHTMDRYDHYFDSVNNKCNLYLTLTTFMFGGLITGYYSIKDNVICTETVTVLVWLGLIACLSSIFFVVRAIIPYVSKHKPIEKISVLNYNCVAMITNDKFEKVYEEMSETEKMSDYINQVQLLAKGLQKKFYYIRIASFFLIAVFVFITLIGIIIL